MTEQAPALEFDEFLRDATGEPDAVVVIGHDIRIIMSERALTVRLDPASAYSLGALLIKGAIQADFAGWPQCAVLSALLAGPPAGKA